MAEITQLPGIGAVKTITTTELAMLAEAAMRLAVLPQMAARSSGLRGLVYKVVPLLRPTELSALQDVAVEMEQQMEGNNGKEEWQQLAQHIERIKQRKQG